MKRTHNHNMGTVSCATMRPEDLIPAFLDELRAQRPNSHWDLIREIQDRIEADDDDDPYFASEDAGYDLEALFDALNEYAPPYFYFGAHPGDGSDYGYWLSEDFPDLGFDGLKVSDTSEVPKSFTGEVLHVNDHGNMTLYVYNRGRGREVWGIV